VTIDDIYLGNGASELIVMAMNALLNNGDEVLVPAPDYPLWTAAVSLSGGKPVHYICDEQQDWYPDIEDMRSKITPNTRAIVVINPNNPTGALYPVELLQQIISWRASTADHLRRRNLRQGAVRRRPARVDRLAGR
jgi:alanine-synthesizing transaminase